MVKKLAKELKKYSRAERMLFFTDFSLAIMVIWLSEFLSKTTLGKASLSFGIVLLGTVTVLKVLRMWPNQLDK